MPNTVTIAGYQFSMPEYMYMLSKTIYYKYNKQTTPITVKYNINNPKSPSGTNIYGKMSSKQYYTYAKNFINYVDKNNQIPNYLTTNLGKMQYQTALFGFNRIIYHIQSHSSKLPISLTLSIGKASNINKILPKYIRPSDDVIPTPIPDTGLTLDNIKDAASRVSAYTDQNGVLPKYVEISGKQYTMPNFLYLLSVAILNINSNSKNNIIPIIVKDPASPTGNSIDGDMSKATYLSLVKNIKNFITSEKQATNYANSPLGKIQYQTLISEFSKILEISQTTNQLPNNININVKSTDSIKNPVNSGNNNETQDKTQVQF